MCEKVLNEVCSEMLVITEVTADRTLCGMSFVIFVVMKVFFLGGGGI
jgi:hypothetical protein